MNPHQSIQQACGQIAPLWPLANFVAVNPFLGFSNRAFADTAHYLSQVQGAQLTMPQSWYSEKFASGEIQTADLQKAIERAPKEVIATFRESDRALNAHALAENLDASKTLPEPLYRPGTFSGYLDDREGTHWGRAFSEEAAKWCAAYYDKGQSTWFLTGIQNGFYEAWHESVGHDKTLACMGLKKAHKTLTEMSADPEEAITDAVKTMGIPEAFLPEFLYRVLLTLPGWAGHLRYMDREEEIRSSSGSELIQLLAILLNYECTLYNAYSQDKDCLLGWRRILMEEPIEKSSEIMPIDLAERLLWQSAFEHHIEHSLQQRIHPQSAPQEKAKPDIQAAFCIDVRSELFRRNLETALPNIHTIGFAGFFGVPLDHTPFGHQHSEARCPALLAPPVKSCEHSHHEGEDTDPHHTERNWKKFKESAASCFSFVETLGLTFGWKMLQSAFGLGDSSPKSGRLPKFAEELDPETRINLAAGILKGLSLTQHCGRLVLLCGHGSTTRNNPYGSGLDCGACGGHPGDANARIAAALLNDPVVRSGLEGQGITIPKDTWFISGLHNTTTDEVTLFDLESIPSSHKETLETLRHSLDQAGLWTAATRAKDLNVNSTETFKAIRARSTDWSQVRPEWGLAGNAGFIVAPRSWTQSSNLEGKAFLHEYDPGADPEGKLLESILAGPLVVGSWINLQYYASSVDNTHFGSGHKGIHNVVGGLGVALGNENDLRPGLPLQSVHTGKQLMHEPSRLHAFVAADPDILDTILERQPALKELLDNGWLHLFSLGANGHSCSYRLPSGEWKVSQVENKRASLERV
ncbi:YbcC family protein [Puniceicoccus vermicola]|uniref:Probable inorganic carbon transporter subunit DabA n=1 Tax=Puniceicoccus vermicola TaxID=388746 RepID=A0A7X1E484_9BACT|nr:DUF2309 domain-containing protein [Puniceicoccus vermicola]MBC2601774.1 DUF2309 domain-containing protein [Puniceicoccus vermicola]